MQVTVDCKFLSEKNCFHKQCIVLRRTPIMVWSENLIVASDNYFSKSSFIENFAPIVALTLQDNKQKT